jgi:hypothetical protein
LWNWSGFENTILFLNQILLCSVLLICTVFAILYTIDALLLLLRFHHELIAFAYARYARKLQRKIEENQKIESTKEMYRFILEKMKNQEQFMRSSHDQSKRKDADKKNGDENSPMIIE